jgi:hypothetical protein
MAGQLDPRLIIPEPPTNLADNLVYRQELLDACEPANDPNFELRNGLWQKCASGIEGCLFWFNAFVWTRNPKKSPPRLPMLLYPFQQDLLRELQALVDQDESVMIDKSREMGISWLIMGWCTWHWLFTENGDFLVGSRKDMYVDGKGTTPLLPKVDYILKNCPEWMLPPGYRKEPPYRIKCSINNPVTECEMQGEATNPDFGRGGRTGVVILDEHGSMRHAEEIQSAVSMNGRCFISITTPKGRGTYQAQLRFSGEFRVLRCHWTDHPEWQEGRYRCKPGCRIHPRGDKPHGARYDAECKKLKWDPVLCAQELDIDYAKAGVCPFNTEITSAVIELLRSHPPKFTNVDLKWQRAKTLKTLRDPQEYYERAGTWRVKAYKSSGGPLRIYQMPFSCRNPKCKCHGTGRHSYVLGGDVSKGLPTGDYSVAYILDITTETIVAEWHGKTDPDLLAEEWAKLAKFYGTSRGGIVDAYCAVEWNDQGLIVNRYMDMMGLPMYLSKSQDKARNKFENRIGVVVSRIQKPRIVMQFASEINTAEENDKWPRLFCPFVEMWDECETMVSSAAKGELTPDERRMGATYGCKDDRVMAAVHCVMGAMQFCGQVCDYVDEDWLSGNVAA